MACLEEGEECKKCCCKHCEHDLGPKCCCKCLPRSICAVFDPNDPNTNLSQALYTHQGIGVYTGGGFGLSVQLNAELCQWEFISYDLDIDEVLPIDSPGDCVKDPLVSFGGVTIGGKVGTLRLHPRKRVRTPWEKDDYGCWQWLCPNCKCFPRCLCVQYAIHYQLTDDDVLINPELDFFPVAVEEACWDEGLKGWSVSFPGSTCLPAISGTFRLVKNEYGDCEIRADIGPLEDEPSQNALNCNNFSAIWNWEVDDPLTEYNTGTAGLQLLDRECSGCQASCCNFLPDTLSCTLDNFDSCCDPEDLGLPFELESREVTLHRNVCGTPVWESDPILIPRCPGDPNPPGNCDFRVRLICVNCIHRTHTDECECRGSCLVVQYSTSAGFIWTNATIVGTRSCDPLLVEATGGGYHGNVVTITITE